MSEFSVGDLYERCIHSSEDDCLAFFRIMNPILRRIAFRVARQYDSVPEVDDLMQEIALKLTQAGETILAVLPKEEEQAKAFLAVTAANVARDFFRNRGAAKRGRAVTVSLNTEMLHALGRDGTVSKSGFDSFLVDVEKHLPKANRERIVFRLYYQHGFTAREIASIPALSLTVKGVESMIYRIVGQLRKDLGGGGGGGPRMAQGKPA